MLIELAREWLRDERPRDLEHRERQDRQMHSGDRLCLRENGSGTAGSGDGREEAGPQRWGALRAAVSGQVRDRW